MNEAEKERLIKKDLVSIENRVRHAFNQGYEMGLKENKKQSGDAISRQATVERLCRVADFMNEKRRGLGSPYVMAALFIQDNKDEFPPVTPQSKTGRWITSHIPESVLCECSACGFTCGAYSFNYCPNCGAKMQEVEE